MGGGGRAIILRVGLAGDEEDQTCKKQRTAHEASSHIP